MPATPPTAVIQTTTRSVGGGLIKSLGFIRIFHLLAIILFFIIPIIQAVIIGFESGVEPAAEFIIPKFLQPSLTLHDTSELIIEQGGLVEGEGFFGNIWEGTKVLWTLFQSLWVIWKWIWIFAWMNIALFIQDHSKKTAGYTYGILTFFIFQILLLLVIPSTTPTLSTGERFILPLKAIYMFAFAVLTVVSRHTVRPPVV